MKKEGKIKSKGLRAICYDINFKEEQIKKPIIIFCHGFKGFKDWGHFNLISDYFSNHSYFFIKFNFSHNGGTENQMIDFPDLEAFGKNKLSIEQNDIERILHFLEDPKNEYKDEFDLNKIYLIGHSRGGGSSIIKTVRDSRIKKLVTWGSISDFDRWNESIYKKWEEEGVLYIENGRTKQQMPLNWELIEDYRTNFNQLCIEKASKEITIPTLIIHGTNDLAVNIEEAHTLKEWIPSAQLSTIEAANHTFGGVHPYLKTHVPEHTLELIKRTDQFLRNG